jgi:hypothetical protein
VKAARALVRAVWAAIWVVVGGIWVLITIRDTWITVVVAGLMVGGFVAAALRHRRHRITGGRKCPPGP